MTTKKITKNPTNYVVVIAEYDEGGSDGLAIDNALIFGSSDEVAKFIAEDYNDTLLNAFGDEDEDHDKLTAKEVLKVVKCLKVDNCTEWNTPSDAQCWVKWKVFARA
jgi:hypothetical protein